MKSHRELLSYNEHTRDHITFPSLHDQKGNVIPSEGAKMLQADSRAAWSSCPYCGVLLVKAIDDKLTAQNGSYSTWLVLECRECGWWLYDYYVDDVIYTFARQQNYAILRRLDVSSIEVPLTALRTHVEKHFDSIRDIHPRKFEDLCQSVFQDYLDCEVRQTGYSRDGGVDLYAVNGTSQYAIQLKRRSTACSESIAPVRDFLGAVLVNGAVRGIYCTTADHFSPDAVAAARSTHLARAGFTLELIDYSSLLEIFRLSQGRAQNPWQDVLDANFCTFSTTDRNMRKPGLAR